MENLFKDICFSAQRALRGQTPTTMRAYSFEIDHERKIIKLRAHFGEPPSEDDLEAISVVETEIDADFVDHFEGETDIEIAAPGESLALLPDGVAYLRDGEPGTVCSSR